MCMQAQKKSSGDRLVRKQVLLTATQNASLKELSASTNRSEGDLVREAVDVLLESKAAEQLDWKAGLLSIAGTWKDRTDLEEMLAENRKRRAARRERIDKQWRGGE